MIKTGISEFDELIGGGIQAGFVILIEGPVGSGKSFLINHLAMNAIKQNLKMVYVCSNSRIGYLKEFFEKEGADVLFVDFYSWKIRETIPGTIGITTLSNIAECLEAIKKACEEKQPNLLLFDSLSDVILYNDQNEFFKCLSNLVAFLKSKRITTVMVIEKDLHDDKVISLAEYLSDGVIETRINESERQLRVLKMLGTSIPLKWITYELTPEGIKLIEQRKKEIQQEIKKAEKRIRQTS